MARSKIKAILAALSAAFMMSAAADAYAQQCHHGYNQNCRKLAGKSDRQFEFALNEIIYKADDNLARVCGNITGTPHTSARIDSVTFVSEKRRIKANDIDGVDFERYFQWEDDGNIYIEIDFPGYRKSEGLLDSCGNSIVFHTAKGDITIPFGKRRVAK